MKSIYLSLTLGLLATTMNLAAQTPKLFHSVQSPNSSSLKSSVESPVTLEVGKAGVTIPIYTVADKDLNLPLTLGYNSSGVKPDVHPGWVGQGMQLSAGMITRNVRGVPDEAYWRNDFVLTIGGANTGSDVLPVGYFYNYGTNAVSNWNTTTKITDLAKDGSNPGTFWKDAEPDEFVFQCGGYSGKFYVKENGAIEVEGRPDIRVEADVAYNIPFGFDPSVPLDPNNPASFSSVNIAFYDSQGYPVYSFNRSFIARLLGFRITTPDGVVYEFGMYGDPYDESDTFDEVEFTADIYQQYYFDEMFTTWYLKKVSSPLTGAQINLVYERGNPIIQTAPNFSYYKMGGSAPGRGFLGWLFGGVSAYSQAAQLEFSGRFIRPTYLKYIETSDTRVEFGTSVTNELRYDFLPIVLGILDRSQYYDPNYIAPALDARLMIGLTYASSAHPGYPNFIQWAPEEFTLFRGDGLTEDLYFNDLKWRKLDYIGIKAKGGAAYVRQWNFTYTASASNRLQLLSAKDSEVSNPYTFTYDNSTTLPGYNSMRIDHWGFHNDRSGVPNLSDPSTFAGYKNIREPVDSYLYSGMLKRVTYPTGGYKEFTFEPNKYKAVVTRNTSTGSFSINTLSAAKSGGGLRIKAIRESAGDGQPDMVTQYTYGDGLLNGDIQYYWPGYTGRLFNGNTYTSDRFISESLIPATENTAGGIVSYAQVTEQQVGQGRTEYDFIGFADNPDLNGVSIDPQKSPYSPFSAKSSWRGMLREKRVYDNATTLPILRETYTYQANPGLAGVTARAVQARGLRLFGTTEVNAVEGTAYVHYLSPYQLKSKRTETLDKTTGTYFSVLDEFAYDNDVTTATNDGQLKEQKTTNSDGSVTTSRFKHTLDYTGLGTSYPESQGITGLLNRNMLDKVIVSDMLHRKTASSSNLVISAALNTYRPGSSSRPVANRTYSLDVTQPITSYSHVINGSTFQPDSRFGERLHFRQYDTYNNPTEIRTNGTWDESYIWGYNGRFVLVSARNATVVDIAYTGFETTDKGNWSYSGATLADATAPTGARAYSLGGGSMVKTGLTSSLTYLLTYWAKSASATGISGGTATAVRSKGGWTQYRRVISGVTSITLSGSVAVDDVRLHPINASMDSYTYDPLIGMTSHTDPSGAIFYYEYDGSGRLQAVRDLNGNLIEDYNYHYRNQ